MQGGQGHGVGYARVTRSPYPALGGHRSPDELVDLELVLHFL
jgi:hypothetical protein